MGLPPPDSLERLTHADLIGVVRDLIGEVTRMRAENKKLVGSLAKLRVEHRAAKAFDRPINAALFEDWVEKCLVPTLSPGDVVVMDNLSSHKGPRVEQLIKAAGAELRYLPPYSPDMNPIEKAYSKLKAYLRKIAERTVTGLMRALETCADIFKPAECKNYFNACGYDTG
jgi:transposase